MPNHCYNELEIEGPACEVERWVKAHTVPATKGKEEGLTFEGSVPMPDELRPLQDGPDSGVSTASADKMIRDKEDPASKRTLVKRYGYDNWYDWSVFNWGTKWDAYEVEWHDKPITTYTSTKHQVKWCDVSVAFVTAWQPPEIWLNTMAAKYGALSFTIIYRVEGMDPSVEVQHDDRERELVCEKERLRNASK
jgi:hypothetical protein